MWSLYDRYYFSNSELQSCFSKITFTYLYAISEGTFSSIIPIYRINRHVCHLKQTQKYKGTFLIHVGIPPKKTKVIYIHTKCTYTYVNVVCISSHFYKYLYNYIPIHIGMCTIIVYISIYSFVYIMLVYQMKVVYTLYMAGLDSRCHRQKAPYALTVSPLAVSSPNHICSTHHLLYLPKRCSNTYTPTHTHIYSSLL